MNKDMFFGWKEVCAFSYIQTMKSKAMKVMMAIICLLILFALPVVTLIQSGHEEEKTNINTVYISGNDENIARKFVTSYSGDYEKVQAEWISQVEMGEKKAALENEKNADYVLIDIKCESNMESEYYGLEFESFYGAESEITKTDLQNFAEYLLGEKERFLLSNSGLDETEMANLLRKNQFQIHTVNADGTMSRVNEGLNQMEYAVVYAYLMVIMFAVIIAGSKVAELIVTEKTSKVMEYLLTSIKALALMFGKVISTLLIVLTVMAAFALSFLGSLVLNYVMTGGENGFWPQILRDVKDAGIIQAFSPMQILVAVGIVFLGFLFYGFIAGLAGATVGKVEELSEGLKLFTFAVIIGAYLVIAYIIYASAGGETGMFSYLVYYLPFSSVFLVPIYLILGKISLQTGIISMVILAVSTLLVWFFVTKVFESVLYHNGSVVKLKEILEIYRNNKRERKSTEVNHEK